MYTSNYCYSFYTSFGDGLAWSYVLYRSLYLLYVEPG